jgi:hypothetical protein
VFVGSPNDVAIERQIVRDVLEAVNKTVGQDKEVRFEAIGWETDSIPSYGQDAQKILNEQIGDMASVDLFVGIMWNRFGSATPRAGSGTEEEFRRAFESLRQIGRPAIMFYFNRMPFDASTSDAVEQKLKVLRFKEEMQKSGLTQDYSSPEEFRHLFRSHLERWVLQHRLPTPTVSDVEAHTDEPRSSLIETPPTAKKNGASYKTTSKTEIVSESGMWILLGSKYFLGNEVKEIGDRKIILLIAVSNAEEDAFFRSLQPRPFGSGEMTPFAHQNTAGLARVTDVQRRSSDSGSLWEVTLELQEPNTGFGSDMAFGSISADEIAILRARLILLNEETNRFPSDRFNQGFLQTLVSGVSTPIKASFSAIPILWKDAKGDSLLFLQAARLWSIFHLISTNTCEHILELTLGPIKESKMHVRFRGQRRKVYSNQDPFVIEVEGDCDLSSK